IVEHIDSLPLTIIAAITFFAATVGINMLANFIPPAYDLANLMSSRINFRIVGAITAIVAFFIGALWITVISRIGIDGFVNTLGAVLAPVYGVMLADYYWVRKLQVDIQQLFTTEPQAAYHYFRGWNRRALVAFALGAMFSVPSVWLPQLSFLGG